MMSLAFWSGSPMIKWISTSKRDVSRNGSSVRKFAGIARFCRSMTGPDISTREKFRRRKPASHIFSSVPMSIVSA
ncbi:MAG: hypothetical protein A4E64_00524 [Syntrophorhabdus sp. PtaU1.Bin058]|nr:MAG: hypothetical protein A4E64_00524 [Syntrophorhabdus sp. PtaU1.Bin058]